MSKRFAPKGTVWVCRACGKTAQDRYGMLGKNSKWWDESCMLHAVLCDEKQTIDGNGRMIWNAVDQNLAQDGLDMELPL